MNMQTSMPAEQADAIRETVELRNWFIALADYRAKRAASDAIPPNGEGEDEAVDAYAVAMDHLLENVPAPDLAAARKKVELINERWKDVESVPWPVWLAVAADFVRLSTAAGSLILQLHGRYERIWDAHAALDEVKCATKNALPADLEKFQEHHACERGMGELAAESLLVERLLLRQVPNTDEDATVLMVHARNLYDGGFDLNDDDRQAIEVALTNATDYFISEGRADMERMGRQFTASAMHCWSQRRHREGLTDQDD